MYRISIFLLLFGIWIVFSGQFDAFHLALGLISTALVTAISSNFFLPTAPEEPGPAYRKSSACRGISPGCFTKFFLSNLHILKLALSPGDLPEVQPRLVRIRTGLKTDFAKWFLANSITLTPGTITIDIEGDELLIHSISEVTTTGVEDDAMERKIASIFERGND